MLAVLVFIWSPLGHVNKNCPFECFIVGYANRAHRATLGRVSGSMIVRLLAVPVVIFPGQAQGRAVQVIIASGNNWAGID